MEQIFKNHSKIKRCSILYIGVWGFFARHKICEKLGKCVTFFIQVRYILQLKKFLIANTGYTFCVFDILWCESDHNQPPPYEKLDHCKNLPDIQYTGTVNNSLYWRTSSQRWYVYVQKIQLTVHLWATQQDRGLPPSTLWAQCPVKIQDHFLRHWHQLRWLSTACFRPIPLSDQWPPTNYTAFWTY